MLILGLMLIRNENDILAEVLAEHLTFCDHIFVLDGTTDNQQLSAQICTAHSRVSYYTEAQLPANYPRPIRDGCRQFLVDKARQRFGACGWFVLLHGDEIFVDNPRLIAQKYNAFFDCLTFDSLNYFIHKEQEPFKLDPVQSIQKQIVWYAGPGWPETRMFKNKSRYNYNLQQHSNVTPKGILINYKTTYKIKHYSLRHPEQQQKRVKDRLQVTSWQNNDLYQKAAQAKYYLAENDFDSKFYRFISKQQPKPRFNDNLFVRLKQDLQEHYSSQRVY